MCMLLIFVFVTSVCEICVGIFVQVVAMTINNSIYTYIYIFTYKPFTCNPTTSILLHHLLFFHPIHMHFMSFPALFPSFLNSVPGSVFLCFRPMAPWVPPVPCHFDEVRQVKMGATKLSVSHEVLLPLGRC